MMKWVTQLVLIKQIQQMSMKRKVPYIQYLSEDMQERENYWGIINGDFYATGQQMTIYSAFVEYLKII